MLDQIFGANGDMSGDFRYDGNKWSRNTLRENALEFISGRDTLSMKNDAGVWTTKVLHQTALGLYLSDSEAQAFVDLQTKAVVLTALPSFAPNWFGKQLGLSDTLSKKEFYLKIYRKRVAALIESGDITHEWEPAEVERGIEMSARGLLDALIFAGGLSVPGLIFSGLAAYYTGLTGTDFDINDPLQAPLLVMETVRYVRAKRAAKRAQRCREEATF